MKALKSLMCFVALFAMMSCDNDDPIIKSVIEYYNCFNLVENQPANTSATFDSPHYVITQDHVTGEASVLMKNVKFAERMPAIDMLVKGLRYSTDKETGALLITGSEIVPVVDGKPYEDFVVTTFRCEIRDYGLAYLPDMSIVYTVNNVFRVTVIPTLTYFYGTTTVVNNTNQSAYETTDPVYKVVINPKDMTANITLHQARFAASMPPMNMVFKGVNVTPYNSGYDLKCDSLIPEIGDVPYPQYQVTNLVGVENFLNNMKLDFDCMGVYSVSAKLNSWPIVNQE